MHETTRAIGFFENENDAKKAGYTTRLTQPEAEALLSVPRSRRKSELKKMRKHKRAHERKERAKARARK